MDANDNEIEWYALQFKWLYFCYNMMASFMNPDTVQTLASSCFLIFSLKLCVCLLCRWWLWPQCARPQQWDSVLSGLSRDIPQQHSVWVGDQRSPRQQDPLSLCRTGHRKQRLPGQLPLPLQRHRTWEEQDWWADTEVEKLSVRCLNLKVTCTKWGFHDIFTLRNYEKAQSPEKCMQPIIRNWA